MPHAYYDYSGSGYDRGHYGAECRQIRESATERADVSDDKYRPANWRPQPISRNRLEPYSRGLARRGDTTIRSRAFMEKRSGFAVRDRADKLLEGDRRPVTWRHGNY